MQRIPIKPRDNLSDRARETGFELLTVDGSVYWDESAYYAFSLAQIEDDIEGPTKELAELCLALVDRAVGDQIEINLIRAIMTDNNPWLFLTRPISGGLLGAAALSVALAIWQHLRHQKRVAEEDTDF